MNATTPPHRREPYRIPRPPIDWTHVGGWIACALGAALFFTSFVAASAGFTVLPFDQHHLIGQAGGLLIAIAGMSIATRRRDR